MAARKSSKAELEALIKRDHSLNGGVIVGLDGFVIELQARAMAVSNSRLPWRHAVGITGMARGAVYEALDRISGAFSKFEVQQPQVEIVINLAPPDLPKDGTWLDLPIAIIMMQAAGLLPDLPTSIENKLILLGEVSLHGEIRRVPGVLSMAFIAQPGQTLIVPKGNEMECALIMAKPGHEGCKVCPVSTLQEVISFFRGEFKLDNALGKRLVFENLLPPCTDFSQIRGQQKAKNASIIAAAGGHNLLMVGPPGEGKSLIAGAIPGILPHLTNDEKVDLTRIYSACGELGRDGLAVTRRPMRRIHHTTSKHALIGGGSGIPRPGEITLAHLGVLFLDELAEFSGATLESLRQPIEDGKIHISRVGAKVEYPCRFTLVAAMNPCPCGYWGTDRCRCSEVEVRRYQKKLSGPILDRIDLQVELARLSSDERFDGEEGESSRALFEKVTLARERQINRFRESPIPFNAAIPGGRVRELCCFSEDGFAEYRKIVDSNEITTRSMDRLAKVARTVADLEESDHIHPDHIATAADYVIGGPLRSSW